MKTVKFSLNELMSEIDESFIEEVYFHDCNCLLYTSPSPRDS